MRKTIVTSVISAIIGGLVVFGAIYYLTPLKNQNNQSVIKEIIPTKTAKNLPSGKFTAEQIYAQQSPAVVNVGSLSAGSNFFGVPSAPQVQATGSGFVISKDGLVITNEHVVEGADSVRVTLADKTELPAKVLGTDRSTDLAVLKIDNPGGGKITPLEIGDSSNLRVGDTVYTIGNPLGLDRSMSQGIISALDRTIDAPNGFQIRNVIQTDAAVNQGNSGGPLIDTNGNVIGITAQIASNGGSSGNIGIAFAIPSNTIKDIINQIGKGGKISHSWIGISGRDVNKSLADQYKLPVNSGAMVAQVFPNSPASKAGLKGSNNNPATGDIIADFGGTQISTMDDLVKALEKHKVGEDVKITYYRGGKKTETNIKLEERPQTNIANPTNP